MKRRNHYVWKHYLKPWVNSNGKIVYKRNGKINDVNINNIAVERFFYKMQILTVDDFKFIETVFSNEKNPAVFKMNKEWLNLFSWVNMLIKLKDKIKDNDIQKDLDALTKEFNENIHNSIENSAIKYLEQLYNKDLSFYATEEGNSDFNFFICEQYFRTRDMKKRMMKTHIPVKNVNFENCWPIASHILAINLAGTLSIQKDHFKAVLLDNDTVIPFITSDQPIINIAADKNANRKLSFNEFEFYYPITPKIAFLLCVKNNLLGIKHNVLVLDDNLVKKYNSMVKNQGGEIIFSSTRDAL